VSAVVVEAGPDLRPRDRAMYLAALAVGLAEAELDVHEALSELREAAAGRRGDLLAARRRLYASSLGSCASRRQAARLLELAVPPIEERRAPTV
jgi:hypothetical protein